MLDLPFLAEQRSQLEELKEIASMAQQLITLGCQPLAEHGPDRGTRDIKGEQSIQGRGETQETMVGFNKNCLLL